jgi:hypothetical protein
MLQILLVSWPQFSRTLIHGCHFCGFSPVLKTPHCEIMNCPLTSKSSKPRETRGPSCPSKVNRRSLLAPCFHAGFFLGLFFDPEDGGDIFLRNVGWLSTGYTALYPRIWYSSSPLLWEPQILQIPKKWVILHYFQPETMQCNIPHNSNLPHYPKYEYRKNNNEMKCF